MKTIKTEGDLLKESLLMQIQLLKDHQSSLFEQGHTFWFCDAQDIDHKKPFYYYQINKSIGMATCGNCNKLMLLRKQIREIEKRLGIIQTPLYTNSTQDNLTKHVSCSNSSEFNPNYAYM